MCQKEELRRVVDFQSVELFSLLLFVLLGLLLEEQELDAGGYCERLSLGTGARIG